MNFTDLRIFIFFFGQKSSVDYKSTLKYKGVIPVNYCGLGCVLLSRKVFEQIPFRYEQLPASTKDTDIKWDDICLCQDAEQLGFTLYAELSVKCEHLYYGGYSATLGDTRDIQRK